MFKRIFLMLAVNVLIMLTLSVILQVLGIDYYITQQGINYQSLLVFCFVWGMGGAFISLFMSKTIAKWTMGLQFIDPRNASGAEAQITSMVHRHAAAAGLPKMPDVAIYDSPEINAFATGPSKSNSLVAVSTGLLHNMTDGEVEGVIAHEVAHIQNGDMVTMTLIQGVVNAFVMFFARIAAFALSNFMRSDDDESPTSSWAMYGFTFLFEIIFGALGMLVVAWFSRAREFRADAGGAALAGRGKMTAALQKLMVASQGPQVAEAGGTAMATMKISSGSRRSKLMELFSTHPPLEDRIAALQSGGVGR